MARLPKEGFDYFPHDVTMHDDTAIMVAHELHGDFCTVFAVYNLILQRVYEKHGYYMPWDEAEALRLKRVTALPMNEVQRTVCALVDAGVFDEGCYKRHKVLTSLGIQRRYLTLAEKRKSAIISPWLRVDSVPVENPDGDIQPVENSDGGEIDEAVPAAMNPGNDTPGGINPEIIPGNDTSGGINSESITPDGAPGGINSPEMQQSKVKESKGKESKKNLGGFSQGFKAFWAAYPHKVAKAAAQKAWLRLKPDDGLVAQILAAVELQKASPQWRKDNGQFIPYPTTWLNQRRWEDEGFAPPPELAAYGRVDIVAGG